MRSQRHWVEVPGRSSPLRVETFGPKLGPSAWILPGLGYHPDKPLFYLLSHVLLLRGFRVVQLFRDPSPGLEAEAELVAEVEALQGALPEDPEPAWIFAKSLGTLQLAQSLSRVSSPELQLGWITPLAKEPEVLRAIRSEAKASWAFLGAEDPWVPPSLQRELEEVLGPRCLVFPEADHGLCRPDSARRSAETLVAWVDALETQVLANR